MKANEIFQFIDEEIISDELTITGDDSYEIEKMAVVSLSIYQQLCQAILVCTL